MARMYRSVAINNGKNLGGGSVPQLVFSCRPLQGDQAPGAYLQKIKVSIIQENYAGDVPSGFMLYATTKDSFEDDDIVTAQAVPAMGGTVWLSLKRAIRSYTPEEDRSDGPIYVFARALDPGATPGLNVEVHLVAEIWGRYVMVGAH